MITDERYKPSDNYDALRKQYSAMRNLCFSLEQQLSFYRDKDFQTGEVRLSALQTSLESEREMNAILTAENDRLNKWADGMCDKVMAERKAAEEFIRELKKPPVSTNQAQEG